MKILKLSLILPFFCFTLNAQDVNFQWAQKLGGASTDVGNYVIADADGNVYTTGYFYGTADFDPGPGTYNLTSFGYSDVFISKIDAFSNFIWAKKLGGPYSDEYGICLAIDNEGNVYTTGYFTATADFDPGPGSYNLSVSGIGSDIFISKLDASGNFIWAKKFGGPRGDLVKSMALDADGNVYTTGRFMLTSDFDPGAAFYNLTSFGSTDIFISKLDVFGDFLWAKQLGGSNDEIGNSICLDNEGNILLTGNFSGTADFDPGTGTFNMTSLGSDDIFFVKLDNQSNFVWAKQIGGNYMDQSYSAAVDDEGNIYSTGSFRGNADFDPGSASYNLVTDGSDDIFISKIDALGNFVWARHQGGNGHNESGKSITLDDENNVYLIGNFYGTVDFDPGPAYFNLTPFNSQDIFISKLNVCGNLVWAKQLGGMSFDEGNSVCLDLAGNILATGYFYGTADFNPGYEINNLTTSGLQDVFIVNLHDVYSGLYLITQPLSQTRNVCNQATFDVSLFNSSPYIHTWFKNGVEITGVTGPSFTTQLLTLAENSDNYYCIVSDCEGIYLDTSATATLTVVPPCIYNMPGIILDKSIVSPGQSIVVSGSNFTPYGQIDLEIRDESGKVVGGNLPITYLNPGMFSYTLTVDSSFLNGVYTVSAIDLSTGTNAPVKTFLVDNYFMPDIVITSPTSGSTFNAGKLFDISFTDYVKSNLPSGQTGFVNKNYKIEISENSRSAWTTIKNLFYEAQVNQYNPISTQYSTLGVGPFIIKITDILNPNRSITSSHFNIVDCDNGGFVASYEWDATVPPEVKTNKPHPMGLSADGTARILIKLVRNNNDMTVTSIFAEITSPDGYESPELLGKIKHADNPDLKEYIEATTTSDIYYGNEDIYWFWLVAPDDFTLDEASEAEHREIAVQFNVIYSDNSTEVIQPCQPISIHRPALVFVHGLGGNDKSFNHAKYVNNLGEIKEFDKSVDIWKVIRKFELEAYASFQTNKDILLNSDYELDNTLLSVIYEMHKSGIANKRVDFIGHSMGGCIARAVINFQDPKFNPGAAPFENYGKGYINKLITICTPHNGSYFADFVFDRYKYSNLLDLLNEGSYIYDFGDSWYFIDGQPCPAIENLQSHSGGVDFGDTQVANHLIGSEVDRYNNLNDLELYRGIQDNKLKILYSLLSENTSTISIYFNSHYQNNEFLSHSDFVVQTSSQLAGDLTTNSTNILTNPSGISNTSMIYGIDCQHLGIQSNLFVGDRIKRLLNARMNSGFFTNAIPANDIDQNVAVGALSFHSPLIDSIFTYFDTLGIKIASPASNAIVLVDSLTQVTVHLKETSNLQRCRLIFQSSFFESFSIDSIQTFENAVQPEVMGRNLILAVAEYDSLGFTVFHIDTATMIVSTLDTLEGFYVTPESFSLNPTQIFKPEYRAIYSSFIGRLNQNMDSLNFVISDTNVVIYDSANSRFLAKEKGTTHIIFSYGGYADTAFIYLSTPINDNVITMCPGDSISLFAGPIDSTRSYQWQADTLVGFYDISESEYYTGADSTILIIHCAPSSWYDYRYRCIISDDIGFTSSVIYTIKFGTSWEGSIDNRWENPLNWNCGVVPDCNIDVIIPSGLTVYPQVISEAHCRSIKIEPGASVNVINGVHLWVGDESYCP